MYFVKRPLLSTSIITIAFFSVLTSDAQSVLPPRMLASSPVILAKIPADTAYNKQEQDAPFSEATSTQKNLGERKRLLSYLKELNVPDDLNRYNSRQKFYYHLAGVFAHLKLYPLAMKCFLKTRPRDGKPTATDTSELSLEYLSISSHDDTAVNNQLADYLKNTKEHKSKRTNNTHIQQLFNDGKAAIGYAMLFHVKQPVAGKRKIFLWANTGHTFITLIKYNVDSTYVCASFGFYPVKDQLLAATPLAPAASATFKDDSGHKWDEVLGKFISRRRFEKILALTSNYAQLDYDLSKNNCTDFGVRAASIAGIRVTETSGKWPLGHGNNPGVTGQSILQGKFVNTDTLNFDGLFVDNE